MGSGCSTAGVPPEDYDHGHINLSPASVGITNLPLDTISRPWNIVESVPQVLTGFQLEEDEDEIDDDDDVDVEERVDDEVDDVVASTAALAILTEF